MTKTKVIVPPSPKKRLAELYITRKNRAVKLQLNGCMVYCIHVEKALITDNASTRYNNNSGDGVVTFEERK